jgi:hypothetical protein
MYPTVLGERFLADVIPVLLWQQSKSHYASPSQACLADTRFVLFTKPILGSNIIASASLPDGIDP